MDVILLGTAAGGGFPQWNCWCPSCQVARAEPRRAHPRSQSSVAVSRDGRRWFLLNASPDVREQIDRLPVDTPAGIRHVPIEGIVLTDAELDHTMGIALLREGRSLQLYATAAVAAVLSEDSRILPVTRAFAKVTLRDLPLEQEVSLRYRDGGSSGLRLRAFPVAGDAPKFASRQLAGHTIGVEVSDETSGGRLAFVPGCGALDEPLLARLGAADLILFDGTFWTEDELITLGIGQAPASSMGHLPVGGAEGSLAKLAALSGRERVFTHINNSNPMLLEDSAERRAVASAGVLVGDDGMRFTI